MRKTKENFVIFGFAVILLIIIFIIVVLLFQKTTPTPQQPTVTKSPSPTSTINEERFRPLVRYDKKAQDKLLDKVETRQTLSDSDLSAKASMLALLPQGQQSGVLYRSANIIIDYVSSADMFQVEILTTDIQQAKAEANVWFISSGMSQEGICDAPVMFYINYETRKSLQNSNILFSPLPNSC